MNEYNRLISYLYEYVNGKREQNAGFLRMEVRGPQCRIRIGLAAAQADRHREGTVSLLAAGEEETREVPLGILPPLGTGREGTFMTRSENMAGSGMPWRDFSGIKILYADSGREYRTYWDDRIQVMERRREQALSVLDETAISGDEIPMIQTAEETMPVPEEMPPLREEPMIQPEEEPMPLPEEMPLMPERPMLQPEEELMPLPEEMPLMPERPMLQPEEELIPLPEEVPPRREAPMIQPEEESMPLPEEVPPLPEQLMIQPEEEFFQPEERDKKPAPVLSDEYPIRSREPRITWSQLRNIYPKILPFGPADTWEVMRISLQDTGRLPREHWVLGANEFVIHGYYDHGHLALMRDEAGEFYFLGVPGDAMEPDRRVAELFGFRQYRPADKGGYWLTRIKL